MAKKTLPQATHTGDLPIGETIVSCAVLENGTRLITQQGFLKAIGRARAAKGGQGASVGKGPAFIAAKNLKPFISDELTASTRPIRFKTPSGTLGYGYRAELLPQICRVYLEAKDRGQLHPKQEHIAHQAEILVRALATVGIVALVDEATGYDKVEERQKLHELLAVYLAEEKLRWAKMFPDEFYRQIYKLKGWQYPKGSTKRTPLVGKITNELVYERLPIGVLQELKTRNPVKSDTNRRKWKHHQFLSEDIGQPDLRDHLLQVIAVMRASANWNTFKRLFVRAFPKHGDQMGLPIKYSDN